MFIVDTDVHNYWSSAEVLLPYLDPFWRDFLIRGEKPGPAGSFPHGHRAWLHPEGFSRHDIKPEGEDENYLIMKEKHLDLYGIDVAILTGDEALEQPRDVKHLWETLDWVVSALLHDIGDIYAPYNHDEYAAAIIRPFVREQCARVVEKHGDFQLIYYAEHVGANPDKRDAYRDSPWFDDCAQFCEQWDQSSFDPEYPIRPLEFFAPMVREVFARKTYDPAVIRPGKRVALSDERIASERSAIT